MSTSTAKTKKTSSANKDELETSILFRLQAEQAEQALKLSEGAVGSPEAKGGEQVVVDDAPPVEVPSDVTVLFCGSKKSGKTSLIDRFITPTKTESDVPKATVALDYKFARYNSDTGATKVLANIFDFGGDENLDELVAVPFASDAVTSMVLTVTVDLSEPQHVFPSLERWLGLLRTQVARSLDALAKESPAGSRTVANLMKTRNGIYAESPDKEQVQVMPVPVVIFGSKFDLLVSNVDPDKRKGLCRALRYLAHSNGASLVFTSTKEKATMNAMRGILRQLLFGTSMKGGLPENVDPARPLCVQAGKDSLQAIGAPGGGQSTDAAWRAAMDSVFPNTSSSAAARAARSEADGVTEELAKYAEASVDAIVEQRQEELVQYRRQVERNQRLASEGLAGEKISGLTAA